MNFFLIVQFFTTFLIPTPTPNSQTETTEDMISVFTMAAKTLTVNNKSRICVNCLSWMFQMRVAPNEEFDTLGWVYWY